MMEPGTVVAIFALVFSVSGAFVSLHYAHQSYLHSRKSLAASQERHDEIMALARDKMKQERQFRKRERARERIEKITENFHASKRAAEERISNFVKKAEQYSKNIELDECLLLGVSVELTSDYEIREADRRLRQMGGRSVFGMLYTLFKNKDSKDVLESWQSLSKLQKGQKKGGLNKFIVDFPDKE